jgi:aminoglycoside/choline kinase family phosphotransferase
MAYGLEREENTLFTGIGRFLEELNVEVPQIMAEDSSKRLVWIEDLGAADLWSFRELPWAERAPHYRSALEQVNLLHRKGFERAQLEHLKLMPGFDLPMYAWERNYFYEKFVGVACGMELKEETKEELEKLLLPKAEALVKEWPSLVHRDFQSQNIMVRHGWTYLIDFQGMRQGTYYYDLASLLYDPYVTFSAEEREEMLHFYFVLPGNRPKRKIFNELFRSAALQRLMQALGAYGFLGIEKGKPAFLKHVTPALNNLESVVSELPDAGLFADLIRECRSRFLNRETL